MNRLLIFMFFLIFHKASFADDYKLLFTVPIEDAEFTTDPLGNFYIYSKGDITRFNIQGQETGRYSVREYGDITFVDASNPMKILVVFSEFSKAAVLDAAMSPNAIVDLVFPGIPFLTVVCLSREGGYWIVDPVTNQLKKFNDQLDVVAEGTPFRQVTDREFQPGYLVDSGNWLVLNAYGYGVMIFDRFGTYYKSILTVPQVSLQASGDELLYKEQSEMVKIDIRTGQTSHFLLPLNAPGDSCRVESNRIFIKSQNVLKIYSY